MSWLENLHWLPGVWNSISPAGNYWNGYYFPQGGCKGWDIPSVEHRVLYVMGAQSMQISFWKMFKVRTVMRPSGSLPLRTEGRSWGPLWLQTISRMWWKNGRCPGIWERVGEDITHRRKGLNTSAEGPSCLSARVSQGCRSQAPCTAWRTTHIHSRTGLETKGPKSRCRPRHAFLEGSKEEPALLILAPGVSWPFLEFLLWLVDSSPWCPGHLLPACLHLFFPLGVSVFVSRFSFFIVKPVLLG